MRSLTRRQFVLGGSVGALALATGCQHVGASSGDGSTTLPPPRVEELPGYAEVDPDPNPRLPDELTRAEQSDLFLTQVRDHHHALLARPRRPADDRPLLTYFVSVDPPGVLTFPLPDGSRCLPTFTSALHAADYRRTLLARAPAHQYMVSSAQQVLIMLRDVERIGVRHLTLNRCPRCARSTPIATSDLKTVDDVLNQWALTTALESSRLQLYLSHALRAARAGELEDARSVALTVAGHVTLDAPKLHLFLGMMALAVQEPLLLFEARAFLRLMHQDALFRQLDEAGERNKPDFDAVA